MNCGRSVDFSGYSVYPTYNTDRHVIAEIWLKIALNTILLTLRKKLSFIGFFSYKVTKRAH